MSAVNGVAGTTGRVARREPHVPARPLTVDAAASLATAPREPGRPPSAGGPTARGAPARAPWQLTIKLVLRVTM
eukprot:scaffold85392_cov30-Tisochrysis_lutea.AAC.8